jgi:hypothetical protein
MNICGVSFLFFTYETFSVISRLSEERKGTGKKKTSTKKVEEHRIFLLHCTLYIEISLSM